MDAQTARIGANEALFRKVNERLESLNEAFADLTGTFEIACECQDRTCFERFTVAPELYERVRSDAALFFVIDGHQAEDVEEPVERHPGFVVVRKHPGAPERLAEETNPRE